MQDCTTCYTYVPCMSMLPFEGHVLYANAHLVMQMTKNPFTSQLLNASELMRGLSPAMVRQVLPLLDQLSPIYTDLAQGRLEFTPEPDETKRLIRTFYGELPLYWAVNAVSHCQILASYLSVTCYSCDMLPCAGKVLSQHLRHDSHAWHVC